VFKEQVHVQPGAAIADAIDQIGLGRAQVARNVGVVGDLQGAQLDLGEERGGQVLPQEVLGNLPTAEAFAEKSVMRRGDVSHGTAG